MAPVLVSPINVGHIDDVQELRRTKPRDIPERFVRDVNEGTQLVSDTSCDMPIIDFSEFLKGTRGECRQEVLKLSAACEEWGFFQVKNYGVGRELVERMVEMSKEFFMLPVGEKQEYPMIPGTVQGYGQAFVFSENQKLDWCNMFALAR
ncbi:S-norcoclaurine synthase 1-like [Neltuma alba]|uniref:S-norcoclaurine synthase 1-like n=1 Tax=Neltuma alba TaxID=207710 RepID=UPI0010A4988E|nr:S-norcoclaurine synthase 1-like [Prosopis alba]